MQTSSLQEAWGEGHFSLHKSKSSGNTIWRTARRLLSFDWDGGGGGRGGAKHPSEIVGRLQWLLPFPYMLLPNAQATDFPFPLNRSVWS